MRDGQAAAGESRGAEDLEPAQGELQRTPSGRMGARFFKRGASGASTASAKSFQAPAAGTEVKLSNSHLLGEVAKLEAEIKELEVKLEASRSAAVQHAIKKQIAVKKAEKMRTERKIKEAK